MRKLAGIVAIFLCLFLVQPLAAQVSGTSQLSTVTSSLEKLKEQLQLLQSQISSYQQTIKELQIQIDNLKSLSETDKKLLTELTQQLTDCQADLQKAQTLYNRLSVELQSLSVSYTISKQQGKIKTYTIIGLVAVVLGEGIVIALK